jgi:hypothetical protein
MRNRGYRNTLFPELVRQLKPRLQHRKPRAELSMPRPAKRRRKTSDRSRRLREQAAYDCDWCHEQIVVPLDVSAGATQEYVEDCPVCCRPNLIRVEIDEEGSPRIWATRE